MWADDKEQANWWGIWSGLSHCGRCHTLSKSAACPQCGYQPEPYDMRTVTIDGVTKDVPRFITQGAISWSTNVLLQLMKREWARPGIELDYFSHRPPEKQPSQRMMIVILFWTLFEHLMDRFFEAATASLPEGVGRDLLRRYASIGSRMDRLYSLLFETSLQEDLTALGHGSVYTHLVEVQRRRNEFVHGNAEAIDDTLVYETVEKLHKVQEAWVALYNKRCTGMANAPPVWKGSSPF
jgi:hypothetical protein